MAAKQRGDIQVTMTLAMFGFKDADPDDIEFMTVLHQIEELHNVTIQVDVDDNLLEIFAHSNISAIKTMAALRELLKHEPGGEKAWHPMVLMAPAKVGQAGFKALLLHSPQGARPYIAPDATAGEDIITYDELVTKWTDEFREKLFQAAKNIKSSPSEMRMRIQLGVLLLQEWKKNKTEYNYIELETMIRRLGIRGTFSFSQLVGKIQLAYNMLARVYASTDYFGPRDTRLQKLEDVTPKHTLILTTANLKVETEVITVQESDTGKNVLRLGPAKGYRRERRTRAVEIVSSCPEQKYDWNLAVHTRVSVASLPFSHDDISSNAKFTPRPDSNEFPHIEMRKEFADMFKVEQITGKTSWVFLIKDSGYAIEVSIYQIVASANDVPATEVSSGCGVDLFRPGWDELLAARNVAGSARKWSDDFRELFPLLGKRLKDKDGIEHLLRTIGDIHNLVSEVDDQPPKKLPVPLKNEPVEEDLLLSWD